MRDLPVIFRHIVAPDPAPVHGQSDNPVDDKALCSRLNKRYHITRPAGICTVGGEGDDIPVPDERAHAAARRGEPDWQLPAKDVPGKSDKCGTGEIQGTSCR
jgi:hypothetical protein